MPTKRPLYQSIASSVDALARCIADGNDHGRAIHEENIARYAHLLPSGSGFDAGTSIDVDASKPDRLVLRTSYHHMTEGMYDGWTDHDVIITPSLRFGFDMRVTGRDRNGIKDYIAETFTAILSAPAD